ncbi:MAG: hypothetical protein R3B96_12755 [Pirellulaceae bacterium]
MSDGDSDHRSADGLPAGHDLAPTRQYVADAAVPADADSTQVLIRGGADSTFPAEGVPTPLPDRIGKFRIESLLGSGGMGAVYLAHQDDLGREVALKVPSLASPERTAIQIGQGILQRLTHPGIATLYEHGDVETAEETPRHYFAMERSRGPTCSP